MTTGYFVKIQQFEGPLDLLLHLIKVHEIDIFNIDIFLLTNQYLEYLRLIEFRDLQQAGDFLQMAATLLEIKTRMLLPHDKQKADDDDSDDDPMHTLQQRLIEYEQFRAAAEHLAGFPQMGVDIQTNHEWQRLEPFYEHIEAPLRGEPVTLLVLYEHLIKTLPERRVKKVEAKTHLVSIEEKIAELTALLQRLNFLLFQGFYKKFQSRYELVVYIMAVLEMVRWRKLKVYQREPLGPLWLYRPDFKETDLPLTHDEKKRLLENISVPEPSQELSQAPEVS